MTAAAVADLDVDNAGSGHALGMIGENRFICERAPAPAQADLWLHLGASIATRAWCDSPSGLDREEVPGQHGELVADPPVLERIIGHLGNYPGYRDPTTAQAFVATLRRQANLERGGHLAPGELPELMRFACFTAVAAGYRPSLGLFGHHAYFHTPVDGAASISPALLEPVARALARMIAEV